MRRVKVLIPSKDRPLQLLACLLSFCRSVKGDADKNLRVSVSVLWKASDSNFQEAYNRLPNLLSSVLSALPWIDLLWVNEDGEGEGAPSTFGDGLQKILEETAKAQSGGESLADDGEEEDFVLFAVDDCLFYSDLRLEQSCQILSERPEVFSVQFRLNPRVTYSHPRSRFGYRPMLYPLQMDKPSSSKETTPFLLYDRSKTSFADWSMAFDLSCSLYRRNETAYLIQTLRKTKGESAVGHPNSLEASANVWIFNETPKGRGEGADSDSPWEKTINACPSSPVCSVLTINRVQEVYKNPVFEGTQLAPESQDNSPSALLDLFNFLFPPSPDTFPDDPLEVLKERGVMDLKAYWPQNAYFDSVHIAPVPPSGTSHSLTPALPLLRGVDPPSPLVSFVLPARNEENLLEGALESLPAQEGVGPGTFEVIVIDDASSDRTGEVAFKFASTDPRFRVVRREFSTGIAAALNEGLRASRGSLIGRLDADDRAEPCRLVSQLRFLAAHPRVAVLGSSFRTFSIEQEAQREDGGGAESNVDKEKQKEAEKGKESGRGVEPGSLEGRLGAQGEERIFGVPCHPFVVRWRALLCCPLAHPCVLVRKEALFPERGEREGEEEGGTERGVKKEWEDSEGYPEDVPAEDHALWLRILAQKTKTTDRREGGEGSASDESFEFKWEAANMGDTLTRLGRRPDSLSLKKAKELRRSSQEQVALFMEKAMGLGPVDPELVALLWDTGKAGGQREKGAAAGGGRGRPIREAIQLLEKMLKFFENMLSPERPGRGEKEKHRNGNAEEHLRGHSDTCLAASLDRCGLSPWSFSSFASEGDEEERRAGALRFIKKDIDRIRGTLSLEDIAKGNLTSGRDFAQWLSSSSDAKERLKQLLSGHN
uniref:Glycosyltransferase 2-like domain-containing protein n=1 Tax=Chromera velia CCMP2878 TaxID=1169474 RepID=A0A0G4FS62_9ALVE|eukprot:Cvel_18515.t1-p1 / transcript=Cvel_18515.t1 / gene=Cvel_18515 / organism=Chromera_velia_CCMP2878 / gene_product=Bifunctional glycosyltransferase pgtA, putative / transcript_product=Bifunctional glycosyltransferase pgtA, putative / location=Cvel_scaffold1538:23496-28345(-) / protein_length=880 / sequence_SO=supercontig / SO=protein_coding / is_pseudo=false